MKKHSIIYSHGFGVRKDDRGLFPDIAAHFPNAEHIMFDYNQVDQSANTLTVAALKDQANILRQIVSDTRARDPEATIDLICHSQGCLVAAIANPEGIRRAVFIAPPPDADVESKISRWSVRYGTRFTTKGTSYLERKDGSTTIVPPEYWVGLKDLHAQKLYNAFAQHTDLTIVTATQDEVLGTVTFNELSKDVKVVEVLAGHNFEDESRKELIDIIKELQDV